MPTGTILSTTVFASYYADDDTTTFTFILPSSAFDNGSNVIAAEVHNRSTSSSDITFELELISNLASATTITRVTCF
jgi:hypothetical protein